MKATCSGILFLVDVFEFRISGPAGLASPDDALNAMHPALTSYSSVQVMIYVSSILASIAFGVTTLTRNTGVTWISPQ